MPEKWASYMCRLDDQVVSILVNLGLREVAPDPEHPQVTCISLQINYPRPDGLPSSEEFPVLRQIEDSLIKALEPLGAIFVGRVTGAGRRLFYFYSPRERDCQGAVERAMRRSPAYRFLCDSEEDGTWSRYLQVLYPTDEELQRIADDRVIHALQSEGDDLKTERLVYYWAYFPSSDQGECFLERMRAAGFSLQQTSYEEEAVGGRPFAICVARRHSPTPAEIYENVHLISSAARAAGGEYDGWETSVERPKPRWKFW